MHPAGETSGTVFRVAVLVLLFVLIVVVALVVGRRTPPRPTVRGGSVWGETVRGTAVGGAGPAPAVHTHSEPHDHHLGDALHAVRVKHARQLGRPGHPPPHMDTRAGGAPDKRQPQDKRQPKQSNKHWTEYDTWADLWGDAEAKDAYWADVAHVVEDLELDWSEVRETLAEKVYDDREWAGRINNVDGKLQVVELVPSPHAVGEGPLPDGVSAMVPAEVVEKLLAKPGLILFHTHPGEGGGSLHPSPVDMAGAINLAFTGEYAAEAVVSPYGVFLYTPSAETRNKVWADVDVETVGEAKLRTMRHCADLLGAFSGMRSWESPWSLDKYIEIARLYGVEYVVYPNDKYASKDRRSMYSAGPESSYEAHQDYLATVKRLEKALAEASSDTPPPSKSGGRRVRFAPGT